MVAQDFYDGSKGFQGSSQVMNMLSGYECAVLVIRVKKAKGDASN